MAHIEESIAGFKIRGDWGDVVEHGERITRALRETGIGGADPMEDELTAAAEEPEPPVEPDDYDRAFEEWDEWRPKVHERIDEDVSEKTAEQAHVAEGEGEQEGKGVDDDVRAAGEKLTESYEKLESGDDEGAVDRWKDSVKYTARAADTASRQALRRLEDTVYKRVMTQLAPYYFDNALVSANIQKSSRGGPDEQFVFEVNVNDDELKAFVSERLAEYEDVVDRWHVDTEKETETAEAAEGVEPPPAETDGRSKSTTN